MKRRSPPINAQFTVVARAAAVRRLRLYDPKCNRVACLRRSNEFSHGLGHEPAMLSMEANDGYDTRATGSIRQILTNSCVQYRLWSVLASSPSIPRRCGPNFGLKRPATGRNATRREGITSAAKPLKNITFLDRARSNGTRGREFQDRCLTRAFEVVALPPLAVSHD